MSGVSGRHRLSSGLAAARGRPGFRRRSDARPIATEGDSARYRSAALTVRCGSRELQLSLWLRLGNLFNREATKLRELQQVRAGLKRVRARAWIHASMCVHSFVCVLSVAQPAEAYIKLMAALTMFDRANDRLNRTLMHVRDFSAPLWA